jgi:hypothetical protein
LHDAAKIRIGVSVPTNQKFRPVGQEKGKRLRFLTGGFRTNAWWDMMKHKPPISAVFPDRGSRFSQTDFCSLEQ